MNSPHKLRLKAGSHGIHRLHSEQLNVLFQLTVRLVKELTFREIIHFQRCRVIALL